MSALHRQWLQDQAAAREYRRLAAELNACANPNPANKAAAQKVRETLKIQRHARDISNQNKDQA